MHRVDYRHSDGVEVREAKELGPTNPIFLEMALALLCPKITPFVREFPHLSCGAGRIF